jgi:hypothetical protein
MVMDMDMQHGYGHIAWTLDMHHTYVHTCSMDVDTDIQHVIDMQHGDGHAA